jgi:crotonobetainyl-CoA hydratase
MVDAIKVDKKGHVWGITIDCPKASTIDLVTSRVMRQIFFHFRDDPDLGVAVEMLLTGS